MEKNYLDMNMLTDELLNVPLGQVFYDHDDDFLYINLGINPKDPDFAVPDDSLYNPDHPIIEICRGDFDEHGVYYRQVEKVGLIIPYFSKFLNK